MRPISAGSRPQRTTSCAAAAWLAMAVPQAPAPRTVIFMGWRALAVYGCKKGARLRHDVGVEGFAKTKRGRSPVLSAARTGSVTGFAAIGHNDAGGARLALR